MKLLWWCTLKKKHSKTDKPNSLNVQTLKRALWNLVFVFFSTLQVHLSGKTLTVVILHLFISVHLTVNTRQQLTHPNPGTNRPLAPSSWPLKAPVVMGNTNRNRCCWADLPYDPNDIWTHFSGGLGGGTLFALYLWCFVFFCVCASGFLSDIKMLPSPCWGTKRNCHQRRDAAWFCSRPNCRDGRCVYVCMFSFLFRPDQSHNFA